MMKQDAYRLADELQSIIGTLGASENKFSTAIRKLADENEALHVLVGGQFNITVQTTPYTIVESE
jgi:hypothetical protein